MCVERERERERERENVLRGETEKKSHICVWIQRIKSLFIDSY